LAWDYRYSGSSDSHFGYFERRGVGLIGFKFNNGAGDQYGWVRVKMTGNPANNFQVVDYAYGDPGDIVKAGQNRMTPPPPWNPRRARPAQRDCWPGVSGGLARDETSRASSGLTLSGEIKTLWHEISDIRRKNTAILSRWAATRRPVRQRLGLFSTCRDPLFGSRQYQDGRCSFGVSSAQQRSVSEFHHLL
jgi:hypothetical protein